MFSNILATNPSKNRLARNIQILQVFSLQDVQNLALNLASLCTKNEASLARYEKSCKIIFLQEFDKILQETYLTIFCKIARFFKSCKKSFILSASLARKILAKIAYFLQDHFYWDAVWFHRTVKVCFVFNSVLYYKYDLLCENRPFRHIWYFEKYHFETLKPLQFSCAVF